MSGLAAAGFQALIGLLFAIFSSIFVCLTSVTVAQERRNLRWVCFVAACLIAPLVLRLMALAVFS